METLPKVLSPLSEKPDRRVILGEVLFTSRSKGEPKLALFVFLQLAYDVAEQTFVESGSVSRIEARRKARLYQPLQRRLGHDHERPSFCLLLVVFHPRPFINSNTHRTPGSIPAVQRLGADGEIPDSVSH